MVGVYITRVGPDERLFFVSISSSIVRTNYQKMNFTLYIFIYLNSYLPRITSIHTASKNTFEIINCINIRNVEEMKHADTSKCLLSVLSMLL